jgi:hypothetical protein
MAFDASLLMHGFNAVLQKDIPLNWKDSRIKQYCSDMKSKAPLPFSP